jgi:hypothetical protein
VFKKMTGGHPDDPAQYDPVVETSGLDDRGTVNLVVERATEALTLRLDGNLEPEPYGGG